MSFKKIKEIFDKIKEEGSNYFNLEKGKKDEAAPQKVQRLGKFGGFDALDEDMYDTPTFLRKQAD